MPALEQVLWVANLMSTGKSDQWPDPTGLEMQACKAEQWMFALCKSNSGDRDADFVWSVAVTTSVHSGCDFTPLQLHTDGFSRLISRVVSCNEHPEPLHPHPSQLHMQGTWAAHNSHSIYLFHQNITLMARSHPVSSHSTDIFSPSQYFLTDQAPAEEQFFIISHCWVSPSSSALVSAFLVWYSNSFPCWNFYPRHFNQHQGNLRKQ